MDWLLLVTTLPTENSTARMRAWRALKASGAAVLRDGVYLIPDTGENAATLSAVERDVSDSGGTAYVLEVDGQVGYPFAALFDRTDDYRKLAQDIESCGATLDTATETDLSRQLRRLRNARAGLGAIDFFPGEAQRQVDALLQALEARIAGRLSPDEPTGRPGAVPRRDAAEFHARQWATRKHLWVDRVSSAWLIRRFIDPDARFVWLDAPADCPADALGFDFDGADFSHVDTRGGVLVTFETLVAAFGLDEDPALRRLGQIVHFLDVGGLPVPEAAGLERLLRGMRARAADDDALLRDASRMLDDLYLAFEEESKTP